MIWLIKGDQSSDAIVGCNMCPSNKDPNIHELWATRPSGKTMVIFSNENAEYVKEVKRAIDFAIQNGDPVFEL